MGETGDSLCAGSHRRAQRRPLTRPPAVDQTSVTVWLPGIQHPEPITSDHDMAPPPPPSTNIRRTIALAAIGCTLVLAACGSSSKPPAATSNDHALGVKFATCMRGHGVPSFPDPETSGGIQISVSLAKNPSPAFKSAMQACKYLIPADTSPPVASASQKAAAVKLAQCMREHGVPNYPDPTYQDGHLVPPAIADPAINPASPAFGAASKTCQSP